MHIEKRWGRKTGETIVKNTMSRKKLQDSVFIAVMLFVPIANFLIFWLYTNFNSILYAFQTQTAEGEINWSLYNFKLFWQDIVAENSPVLLALRNTLIFFFSNLFITLPCSLLLCYFLYKKIWGYKAFRFIFYLPQIISASVLVILFKYIISAKGPIGLITSALGGEYIPFLTSSKYALATILIYSVLTSFGGNVVLLSGAMTHIDESVIEAAKIDGVTMGKEITHIVIPLVWPTLSTLMIFQFVNLFGSTGPILLFTQGAYDTRTIAYWIYEQVYYGSSYYYPSAIGMIFTLIGTPIALGMRKLLNSFDSGVE